MIKLSILFALLSFLFVGCATTSIVYMDNTKAELFAKQDAVLKAAMDEAFGITANSDELALYKRALQ